LLGGGEAGKDFKRSGHNAGIGAMLAENLFALFFRRLLRQVKQLLDEFPVFLFLAHVTDHPSW
jgi:hypothetical protein